MSKKRGILRILILSTLVTTGFIAIFSRFVFLHLYYRPAFIDKVSEEQKMSIEIPARRGRIIDRTGNILAMDEATYDLIIDPKYTAEYFDLHEVCDALAPLLKENPSKFYKDILKRAKKGNKYYSLAKHRSPEWIAQAKAIKLKKRLGLNEPFGKTPRRFNGIYSTEVFRRKYPKGNLMSHIVGYRSDNGKAQAGVEYLYSETLDGTPGKLSSRRDGKRREIYSRRETEIEPINGADIYLTLDQQLQYFTEDALNKAFTEHQPHAAWAIILRVNTGEILAMAGTPSFNPENHRRAPREWTKNPVIGNIYEPGSTMKAISIASVLNEGLCTTNELIDCTDTGRWYYRGKSLKEYHSHAYGEISVADIIKKSSNIGTAKLALRLGEQKLEQYMRDFGFAQKTGCGLPGEERGLLKPYTKWSKIDITRIPMGHSISVTALQMANAFNCIANGGRLMQPYLIQKMVGPNGELLEFNSPKKIGQPIRRETAKKMCDMLEAVTQEGGTATKAQVPGFSVAGKTGTTMKIVKGRYVNGHNIASFAGFIPAKNPEITILVVLDDPSKNGRTGGVAAKFFSEIAQNAMRYLAIEPDQLDPPTAL